VVKRRQVILMIDDVVRLLRDYAGEGEIPEDAQAQKLMVNPSTREVAIQVGSDSWTSGMTPLRLSFKNRKVYGVS
jgi:hypothetical protein